MLLVAGCAGERQGIVCEEIEYRLNTMTYSPDQRAYMENELRTCREDEAKKKNEVQSPGSIYDRYANTESATPRDTSAEISVQTLLRDSSEKRRLAFTTVTSQSRRISNAEYRDSCRQDV